MKRVSMSELKVGDKFLYNINGKLVKTVVKVNEHHFLFTAGNSRTTAMSRYETRFVYITSRRIYPQRGSV